MAKSADSASPDSTTKVEKSQGDSLSAFKVKAEAYIQLRNLTKFDALVFKRMADKAHAGSRKTVAEWDSFKDEYQNSGNK